MPKFVVPSADPDVEIDVPIYNQTVLVFFQRRTFRRWCEARGLYQNINRIHGCDGYAAHVEDPDGSAVHIIFLENPDDFPVASHEFLHVSFHILEHVGSVATADNHEHLAYLHTCLLKKFLAERLNPSDQH